MFGLLITYRSMTNRSMLHRNKVEIDPKAGPKGGMGALQKAPPPGTSDAISEPRTHMHDSNWLWIGALKGHSDGSGTPKMTFWK